jgi:hypothetical protein
MRHRNTFHLQQTSLVRRQGYAVGVAGEEGVGDGDRLLLKMRDTAGLLPVEGKMLDTADVLQVEGVMKHRLGTLMIHPTAHSANQYRIRPSLLISTFAPMPPRARLWQKNVAFETIGTLE